MVWIGHCKPCNFSDPVTFSDYQIVKYESLLDSLETPLKSRSKFILTNHGIRVVPNLVSIGVYAAFIAPYTMDW